MNPNDQMPARRQTASYLTKDDRFSLSGLKYSNQQYGPLYAFRLGKLQISMKKRIADLWPSLPVCSILDLEEGKECVVIGTLYKQMQLKPSILDDYSKERSNVPLVTPSKFTSGNDYLILEDTRGRVRLIGSLGDVGSFVTGVVIAVRGQEEKDGEFRVTDSLLPGLPDQSHEISAAMKSGTAKYVALFSGLSIGSSKSNPLRAQLLVDYLTGHLGNSEVDLVGASVVRCVIAGDSLASSSYQSLLSGQTLNLQQGRALASPIRELDLLLTQLLVALPVDIMPGASDPATFSLPQQPLHSCLLPGAQQYSTLFSATNPHDFEVEGVSFLGTSGQNIDDLRRYSDIDDAVTLLENSLLWRHMAPTAPDTLGCYPFQDDDPFIIGTCPHVYFCGNQDSFGSKLMAGPKGQRVRLVSIPKFANTGEAVLVNLSNLDCHVLKVTDTAKGQ